MDANPDKQGIVALLVFGFLGERSKKRKLGARKAKRKHEKMTELEKLIEKLKNNRQKVPEDELKTKYAKPYRQLKESIRVAAEKALFEKAFKGISFRSEEEEEAKAFAKEANDVINAERKDGGIMNRISKSLFIDMDVEAFGKSAEEMEVRMKEIFDIDRRRKETRA